jgi:hypothetical protein
MVMVISYEPPKYHQATCILYLTFVGSHELLYPLTHHMHLFTLNPI